MPPKISGFPHAALLWAEGIRTPKSILGIVFCLSLSTFSAHMVWHGFITGCGPRPSRYGPTTFICYADAPIAFTAGMTLTSLFGLFILFVGITIPIGQAALKNRSKV